jgi:hypothetical protein
MTTKPARSNKGLRKFTRSIACLRTRRGMTDRLFFRTDYDRLSACVALTGCPGHSHDVQSADAVSAVGANHQLGSIARRLRLIDAEP